MHYRPEIDGLRSVAIIAVIVFHLDKTWLPGGFLGVDVFFTISGYLISLIIFQECARNEFGVWKFWKRRFRRLVPALVFMVACVLAAGNFLFIRPERTELLMQALSSLFSFANIFFWRTTGGYWTAPVESLPLLHTWTLSLEEQFYLLFPVLVLLIRRFKSGLQLATLCALLFGSLMLCVLATPSFRSASFFLLPSRMWELLLGVCLAYWHHVKSHSESITPRAFRFLPDIGLGLILFSLWAIANDEAFPGWRPLVPCLGTLLLLNSRSSHFSPSLALLKLPVFVMIGKLSYSLYLWHWPVFVFLPYAGLTSPAAKILWTISLAGVSYTLVERPIRYGARASMFGWVAIPGFALFAFALLVMTPTSPLVSDFGNLDDERSLTRGHEYEAIEQVRGSGEGVIFSKSDERQNRPMICLVGSSHARVLGKPIHAYAVEEGLGFLSLATSNLGITTLPHPEVPDATILNALRSRALQKTKPEIIIVAGMWSEEYKRSDFAETLSLYLKNLALGSQKVFVLAQVPMVQIPNEYDHDLRKYLVSRSLTGEQIWTDPNPLVAEANQVVHEALENLGRAEVSFIDPASLLLVGEQVKLVNEELFLYSDYHHVNDDGAQIVFDGVLRKALTEAINAMRAQP